MLNTYDAVPVSLIQEGHRVIDKYGRDYVAKRNAETDQFGQISTVYGNLQWATYSSEDTVTVIADEPDHWFE